jgi:putative Holliday junction resolvase
LRVLALDVGERRIGLALSDPTGVIASPIGAINRATESEDIEAVLRLATEHGAAEIVVGLPLSLSGEMGHQARAVRRFSQGLSKLSALPVRTVDERYTTVQAERLLREAGVEPSRDRARTDAAAAALILQSFLDSGGRSPYR